MQKIYVSKNKPNAYPTVNEALKNIDYKTDETIELHIDEGIYEEKIAIRANNLKVIGSGSDKTILTWHDGAATLDENKERYGTFNSYSVLFAGSNISVSNLTIENTSGPGYVNGQAVAAFITSDKTSFYNCRFIGNQDTIYSGSMTEEFYHRMKVTPLFKTIDIPVFHGQSRNYFDQCYIEGDVDYIFGDNLAYFNHCEIHTKKLLSEGSSAYITAANTSVLNPFGYIFNNCQLIGEEKSNVYLGRPWRDYAKTLFINCYMDDTIHPQGWHNWDKPSAEVTTQYVEIDNHGPGSKNGQRVAFSKQLTGDAYTKLFSLRSIFTDFDTWIC